MKRIPLFLTVLLAASACAYAADPLKVDFVYQSPVSPVGWVAQHEAARKALQKEFGLRITTRVVDNVKVGPDGARVMRELVGDGAGLMVLASFGYMQDGLKQAAEAPDTAFVHASGYKTAPNFATYTARWYEGAYVAGIVAGRMTRSNTLGYVGAMPIPDVVSTINAFTLGVRSVNPAAKVKVVWVNEWFNPPKEREAVQALVDAGADVVGSAFQDNPAVVQMAEEKGVWTIGMFSDVSQYAPKRLLTSVMHDWTPFLRQAIKDRLAGQFKGRSYIAGMADKGVKLLPWNKAVPADVVQQAARAQSEVVAGRLKPFKGPLKDSAGKLRVSAGAELPDAEIAGMNWFVDGVQGSMPR